MAAKDYNPLFHDDRKKAIMVPLRIGNLDAVQFTTAGTFTAEYTFRFDGPIRQPDSPNIEFGRPDKDGNSRKVFRCYITDRQEGQWSRPTEVRQACNASVALRTVEYAPNGQRITSFVSLVDRDLDFETTEQRFYMDVEVGSSQQRADGSVLVEFSYFASFIAVKTE